MAVPGLPLSLLNARAEFGLGAGGLLQLLRSPGGIVPNVPANAGVPQAAPISLSQLVGATSTVVQLASETISAVAISPNDATAGIQLNASGAFQRNVNNVFTNPYNWLLTGSAADYEAVATLNSGTLTSGTIGSAVNLGTTRSWFVQRTANAAGVDSANITVIIRPAGGGSTLATATFQFNAEVDV